MIGGYDHWLAALWLGLAALAIIVILFGRRLVAAQKKAVATAREEQSRFRMLAESVPEIIWTATPDGAVDYCNRRLCELTGLTEAQCLGWGWGEAIHPDDLPLCLQVWKENLKSGEPYQIEIRIRDRTGGFRWHLMRATPVRDTSGDVIKWFGCGSDIDEQMQAQRVLEERVKEHTAALIDANARLKEEMQERAQAQQELNRQNEIMVRELTRRSHRATLLARMAELLQSCAEVKEALSVVLGLAPKIFPDLPGAVLLMNSARSLLEVVGTWAGCKLPADVFEPQACWALRTGRLHSVEVGDHTAECAHAGPEHAYFCVPILAQGETVGILHFQVIPGHKLTESELSVATTFAEQVGLSVANIRLRGALRAQSIRDVLTGLYNRRYLEETLEREIRRAGRADQALGLLMLDLDHFKTFNDTYGHEAGDKVLRDVGAFLSASVRAEDIVCRYGGEEFVIILPTAVLDVTRARAERLCSQIRELNVQHMGKSVGMITVSIGVAVFPEHGLSTSELQAAADAALYRAKRGGRNRVEVATAAAALDAPTSELPHPSTTS